MFEENSKVKTSSFAKASEDKRKSKLDIPLSFFYYSLFILAPFIMNPLTSELFEFNKMIFIYGVTACVLFFWCLKMILNRVIIFKRTMFDIPILLFLFSQFASTLFSIDPHTSLFGYYGRFNGGLVSIIAYIVLLYGFVSNFSTKTVIRILKASLVVSFFVILWGLSAKIGYDPTCFLFTERLTNSCWTDQFRPAERMFSTLGQPNWLGAYLAINFFVGLFFLVTGFVKEKNHKNISTLLLYLYLLFNFIGILFTRSRSSLVAVLVGVLIFIIYVFFQWKDSIGQPVVKKFILFVCPFILIVLVFKTGIQSIDKYLSIRTYLNTPKVTPAIGKTQGNVTESFDIRKIVWQGAINLGKKYPFFGTGVETFAYSYYFVRPSEHNLTSEWDYLYNKAHNEFLNYFATTGYVGLLSYCLVIVTVVGYGICRIRSKEESQTKKLFFLSLLLSYLSILITNFFGFSTTTINLFFYLIPGFFLLTSDQFSQPPSSPPLETQGDNLKEKGKKLIMVLLTMSTFGFIILSLVFYVLADIQFAESETLAKSGDYQNASTILNMALKYRYEHVYEDKLSHNLANLAFLASYEKKMDLAKKLIELSKYYNLKSIRASSSNVLYWKTKAKNYYLYYQSDLDTKNLEEAIAAIKTAGKFSPTDPKIPYSLSVFYSLLFDEVKDAKKREVLEKASMNEIEHATVLKPDYRDAYFLKAQLYEKYGQQDAAIRIYRYILNIIDKNDEEIKDQLNRLESKP
ncbi:hypothetical protein COT62_02675 [Candidatus Roizmanbacteria bacterium CG09_land_8_20_14_0_10_41_9]|uniref:O-antigen ligase-related domain-containing protein n=1 Tax=Candidatus Roizmanbacteria bacterium CG09_land_8_20_14_0_10_41_9 TaxID=1974850 RepID=A0A2H0WSN5_9BACT|nr:MAG: hypothetical protein COT62_02675 [Candidatus Roizmanbacteria bacterium CG09_land_8_20_14_0_10_41_9]